jgi:4-alpha-glucanotransferase
MSKRTSGVLLHISSLPSAYGIGDFGPNAYAFVDFLKNAGQALWQILPLNPTDGINGHSPYSCFSAFAGNPLFISPDFLAIDGFIKPSNLKNTSIFDKNSSANSKIIPFKQKLFELAFKNFLNQSNSKGYEEFYRQNKYWLDDYAIFSVAKLQFSGQSWQQWPRALQNRNPKALKAFAKKYDKELFLEKFIQYLFYSQFGKLKLYANKQGISIVGDIPIYVNFDSVDVWCNREYFKLDKKGDLKFISGCPPDYFSKTGQRWGNPVYDWAALKKAKYGWWIKRIAHNLGLFDYLRIDHFRGFASFWQIPAHEKLAVFGQWVKGPGEEFFNALLRHFKYLPIIAEDLGEVSQEAVALMHKYQFPGMRVLLFAFGGDTRHNPHVPANYPSNCIAYTGTHDNNTVQGWYRQEAKEHERANIKEVLGIKPQPRLLHWQMIEVLMKSKADMVIIPLQDFLGFDVGARMNTPATKVNNWKWRFESGVVTASLANKILKLTHRSKRC